MSNPMLSFNDRLDKDLRGSFITILILLIIKYNSETWGYQIKKEIKKLIGEEVKNSTLYTILRSLEVKYGFLDSKVIDRKRYYSLNEIGISQTEEAVHYWFSLFKTSTVIFKMLNIEIPQKVKEVIK